MVALRESVDLSRARKERVEVASGLCFLLADGLLAGWSLHASSERITPFDGIGTGEPFDEVLAEVLGGYHNLVVYPGIDRLTDGDPAFRLSLLSLIDRIPPDSGADKRRAVL
jgi:hypothetical protein